MNGWIREYSEARPYRAIGNEAQITLLIGFIGVPAGMSITPESISWHNWGRAANDLPAMELMSLWC